MTRTRSPAGLATDKMVCYENNLEKKIWVAAVGLVIVRRRRFVTKPRTIRCLIFFFFFFTRCFRGKRVNTTGYNIAGKVGYVSFRARAEGEINRPDHF